MKQVWAVLLFLGGCVAAFAQALPPAFAQLAGAPEAVVRETLAPEAGAVIGQQVTLYVDVLFRDQMPRPPRVAMPDVPGLQIIRFETQATNMQDRIGDAAYVGQRFEFAVYPHRGGSFDLPPASVTLLDRDGGVSGNMKGQPLRFEVAVPPGVDPSLPVIATSRFTLNEQWLPAPTGVFKAGDAITRVISRSAQGVLGLAMSDLAATAPEGVRAYADPPDISESSNRGVITGHRVDRVTYVFERGGAFDLPAIDQPWWNLDARRLEHATAPAVSVNVAAAPKMAMPDNGARWNGSELVWPLLGLAGLVALAMCIRPLGRRLRASRDDLERKAFAALRNACAGDDARAIYRCFCRWGDTLAPEQRKSLYPAIDALQAALFANRYPWTRADSSRLLAELERLRRPPARSGMAVVLPPLNPTDLRMEL